MKEIDLKKGLEKYIDLQEIILNEMETKYKKNTRNLKKEFNEDKWNFVLNLIKKNPEIKLNQLEKMIEKDRNIFLIKGGKYFESGIDIFREIVLKDLITGFSYLKKNSLDFLNVFELGAGYGSKILNLANNNIFDNKNLFAVDLSKNGINAIDELARRMQLRIKTINSNFFENDFSYFLSDSVVFTSYSLHYWDSFKIDTIKSFIKAGVKAGVHIEPCSDRYFLLKDNLYKYLSLKYLKLNDYKENIGLTFQEGYDNKLIKIKFFDVQNGSGLLPHTLIVWSV